MKSSRPPFTTRTMRLTSADVRDRAIATIRNAPIDVSKPLQLVLREEPKRRSNPQNSLYWALLGDIAEQAWIDKQYPADVWHEHCRRHVMPERITTADGVEQSKWIDMPDGSSTVISTTLLSQKSFAEYITAVEAYGAQLGVLYSARATE